MSRSATVAPTETSDTWAIHSGRSVRDRVGRRHGLTSLLVVFAIAAALAVLLRLFVVQTFYVPTGSMIPTLQVGDRMLVLKVGYTITRGSILVFRQPPADTADVNHEDLVKRVIGLPGETIWSEGNTVYIDGKPLAEPWLPKGTVLGAPIPRQTIPQGEYFMMGDNRQYSDDSRDWGDLPASLIVGKVLVVIWRDGRPAFHIQ
ncbi:MAG TPA: signal peptidase I [Acidimicrobiales bacterium]|nr:signal peptidase I [Acidimicrobiales bacterium]